MITAQERLIVNLSFINKGVFHPWCDHQQSKLLSSYKFNCINLTNETLYFLLQSVLAIVVIFEGFLLFGFVWLNKSLFFQVFLQLSSNERWLGILQMEMFHLLMQFFEFVVDLSLYQFVIFRVFYVEIILY